MKTNKRNSERGVALLMVLMIVILLTAIGAALIFMSNVESTVNLNLRGASGRGRSARSHEAGSAVPATSRGTRRRL